MVSKSLGGARKPTEKIVVYSKLQAKKMDQFLVMGNCSCKSSLLVGGHSCNKRVCHPVTQDVVEEGDR